jgi:FkbM family methyltransferase
MTMRQTLKRLVYGHVPFLRGRFWYYGQLVYFPARSHIFERAVRDGTYEGEVTRLLTSLVADDTTYIDVGANIGLLSVPVLSTRPNVRVISIEAAPATFPFLERTHAGSQTSSRWSVVEAAVGATEGRATFFSAGGAFGAFDGLRDTGRGGRKTPVDLPMKTLDRIWTEFGRPRVSVIKMDIEGGETAALTGASDLLNVERPFVVMEWTVPNLRAYQIEPIRILELSEEIGYGVYAFPSMALVGSEWMLNVEMARTETFLLVPKEKMSANALPVSH